MQNISFLSNDKRDGRDFSFAGYIMFSILWLCIYVLLRPSTLEYLQLTLFFCIVGILFVFYFWLYIDAYLLEFGVSTTFCPLLGFFYIC